MTNYFLGVFSKYATRLLLKVEPNGMCGIQLLSPEQFTMIYVSKSILVKLSCHFYSETSFLGVIFSAKQFVFQVHLFMRTLARFHKKDCYFSLKYNMVYIYLIL